MSTHFGEREGLAKFERQKISRNYEMKPHIEIVYMWRIWNIKLFFIMPTAQIPISSSEMIALSDDDDDDAAS